MQEKEMHVESSIVTLIKIPSAICTVPECCQGSLQGIEKYLLCTQLHNKNLKVYGMMIFRDRTQSHTHMKNMLYHRVNFISPIHL